MRYFFIPLFLVFTLSNMAQPAPNDCPAVDKTNGCLRALQVTVEAYYKDHQRYPEAATIEQLQPLVSEIYIRVMPLEDGWGKPFLYRSFADGKSYILASAGSDGAFDEKTWAKAPRSTKEDAVVRSGQQARLWEGCR